MIIARLRGALVMRMLLPDGIMNTIKIFYFRVQISKSLIDPKLGAGVPALSC